MLSPKSALLAAVVAMSAVAAQAATTVVPVSTDGQWYAFTVDALSTNDGRTTWIDTDYNATAGNANDLSFSFTVANYAILKVVDLYAAGDTYNVSISRTSGTTTLTQTSAVVTHDINDASLPFAGEAPAAWADSTNFSQGQWLLGAGTYTVTGSLLQCVTDGSSLLNSTGGALSVTAVPEPSSMALALAAIAAVLFVSRRRAP